MVEPRYPLELIEGVKKTINSKKYSYSELDVVQQIEQMTKIELMDNYLASLGPELTSTAICWIVKQVFGFDLEKIPLHEDKQEQITIARDLIDSKLNSCGSNVSGDEIRTIINDFFGVNLNAINALEDARLSLYSKGQWVIKNENDLFVVYTGTGDVDVKVYPTAYFTQKTGLEQIPDKLQHALKGIGFHYNEDINAYYFLSPTNEPVDGAFKGQTIGAIINEIKSSYSHI
ncbi:MULTISPECIES: hypothetical protein [Paraliobacillus]|uniref:hypothetical protein n=1 Tax=Paraliobacillus TaxID=200903 RepID=UPI000DD47AB5|nr:MULTISPECIES: hypothetical protein [Paraliobacillus]